MIRALIVVLILMALSACGTPDTPDPIYLVRCPALISYPQDVMERAAGELTAMPGDAAVRLLVADYGALRMKCRAVAAP